MLDSCPSFAKDVVNDNCKMLERIVKALHINSQQGGLKLKRVLLQTGVKHYGKLAFQIGFRL
jgi:hypothetical protein